MKVIGVRKGYTLEVTSWEGDGDYYNTQWLNLGDNLEVAQEVQRFLEDYCGEQTELCEDGFAENFEELGLADRYTMDADRLYDYALKLVGSACDGGLRGCWDTKLTYSPVDYYITVIPKEET